MQRRLAAYYFFYFAFLGAFSTYFSLYLQSLGFSPWQIGVLLSLMQVMRVAAPYFWGWLADRSRCKAAVVRLSVAASTASFALFFIAGSFPAVFAVMALLAFFWSAGLPLVEAITLGHLARQPERYGRIRLWGSVGFIVSVLGLGAGLDRLPLSAVLWAALAMLACTALATRGLLEAEGGSAGRPGTGMAEVLRRPEVRALFLACFFMAFAHAPYYVFYSILLVDHGYSKSLVGAYWSIGVVAEILIFLAMPRLMRHHGVRGVLLASFAAAVLRFLMIGWGVAWPSLLGFAQVLHGATFGAYHAAAITALNRWFAGHHQGRAQALYGSISFGAGGMLGGVVAGQCWEPLGAGGTFTLAALSALAGGALIWQRLPKDDRPDA